ncbi:MAG: hypothetical protein IKC77_05010, partial [Lentisphaeria bacterium]|nr:hypothetical protein [Lentisphaeria bacterium]
AKTFFHGKKSFRLPPCTPHPLSKKAGYFFLLASQLAFGGAEFFLCFVCGYFFPHPLSKKRGTFLLALELVFGLQSFFVFWLRVFLSPSTFKKSGVLFLLASQLAFGGAEFFVFYPGIFNRCFTNLCFHLSLYLGTGVLQIQKPSLSGIKNPQRPLRHK